MERNNWISFGNVLYHRTPEVDLDCLWAIPTDQKAFYLIELRNKAAAKIQAAWRKYQARLVLSSLHTAHVQENAAIVIQKAVRHWLYLKQQRPFCKQHQYLERINEERLNQLQQEVKHWQDVLGPVKAEGLKQLSGTHKEVQHQLHSWYLKSSARKQHEQHIEAKCAQLEAAAILLQDSPALADYESVDTHLYQCYSLSDATEARLNHKYQLQELNTPWWKRLALRENCT